jgi:hypothetical protein
MSDNQKFDQDPNSWPGVVWRYVKGKPALDVVTIILLLLVGYFIGRLYAVDPLEPVVELAANKFSLPAGAPDISGGGIIAARVMRETKSGAAMHIFK